MKFKQTAALGLSALILSGNTLVPYNQAATIAVNHKPEPGKMLATMTPDLLFQSMRPTPAPQHPIRQQKTTLLGLLNPMNLWNAPRKLIGKALPARTAQSVPLTSAMTHVAQANHRDQYASFLKQAGLDSNEQAALAMIHSESNASRSATAVKRQQGKKNPQALTPKTLIKNASASMASHSDEPANAQSAMTQNIQKRTLKATKLKPLSPTVTPNPSFSKFSQFPLVAAQRDIQAPLLNMQQSTTAQASSSTSQNQSSAGTSSVSAVLASDTSASAIEQTKNDATGESAIAPVSVEKKDTVYPVAAVPSVPLFTGGKKPTAEETFQMLAASPLERLALQTKGTSNTQYPAFDFTNAGGRGSNVKVLKSGISQKVTNVDLAVGKAEVIYLSRPASRVSVSNPDVASAVIISPTQIQLVGKAVGVANLLLWGDMSSPEHTIVDVAVHRDVSVLVNQLKYVDPGIQIVPMAAEDTVILTGQAETREAAQLAIEMAKAFFNKGSSGSSSGMGQTASASGSNSTSSATGLNSQAPGSALPGGSTNVINLLKVKGEPSTKLELVRQKLNDIDPNIQIDVVPGPDGAEKVILSGRVQTASIASKALNLASVFYGKPGLKMVTSQGGNDFARMQVSSTSSSGGGGASVTTATGDAAGAANVLQGSVMTDATGNVISMLEVAQKPQIRCNIKFLELSKTSLNALGGTLSGGSGNTFFGHWSGVQSAIRPLATLSSTDMSGSAWRSSGSSSNGGANSVQKTLQNSFNQVYQNGITQVLSINDQFAAAIQALEERRQVRTLAEPTLTMLSGEQGSFLAGGEVPIAFLGGNGQISIEFKEYGIRLNLLPTVTDDGKIQMQVAPEVSTVDPLISVQGVPGFTTRRMSTNLLVEPGQSFALAGLFKQDDTDSVSRFPGIGSLPVIGTFFRNKWKNRTDNEMIVLIRPEIIYSQTGPMQKTNHTGSLPKTGEKTAISKQP